MQAHAWTRASGNSGALSIGTGPPVLLAHGAGGGVKGNFNALATEMNGHRRLIGLDYPGSGNRPVTDRPLRVEALASSPPPPQTWPAPLPGWAAAPTETSLHYGSSRASRPTVRAWPPPSRRQPRRGQAPEPDPAHRHPPPHDA